MTAVFLLTGREPSDFSEKELRRAYREAAVGDPRISLEGRPLEWSATGPSSRGSRKT